MSVRIIKQQATIIGPVAWHEAGKVPGLRIINPKTEEITLEGDEKEIINKLVARYSRLFGKASDELCKESVRDLLTELAPGQIPQSLQ